MTDEEMNRIEFLREEDFECGEVPPFKADLPDGFSKQVAYNIPQLPLQDILFA